MNISDINNLDFNNAGNWPAPVKAVAIVLLCAGVVGAGYWFDTKEQLAALEKAERVEVEKKEIFENKQRKAANLEPLREQLEEMKQSFGAMLRQLPNQAEIDALLVDISQTGLASGLEFDLFQPQNESQAEFYAEKPIKIRVTGTYHEFGEFVSGVAALPRIVTQHDIKILPKKGSADELVMEATAKTYRYIEEQGEGDS
ncbi:MAG: type 4a pilus biogenesis protein PilO [Gammaproteobacteria bacterium]|nr:type 4a pilus biogenesis protein PilO [Gammaproteobacteria bacterium]MDJ0870240.1 type 4a pilus biogenesis protein PilO [Gammaproteobacteria bacterium]MDJ0890029.1 type 4a pilus biogenesis protein PilO [Gammaproteobacteria bacterium]